MMSAAIPPWIPSRSRSATGRLPRICVPPIFRSLSGTHTLLFAGHGEVLPRRPRPSGLGAHRRPRLRVLQRSGQRRRADGGGSPIPPRWKSAGHHSPRRGGRWRRSELQPRRQAELIARTGGAYSAGSARMRNAGRKRQRRPVQRLSVPKNRTDVRQGSRPQVGFLPNGVEKGWVDG